MHKWQRPPIPPSQPLQVHQARHVGRRQHFRPRLQMIGDPVLPHQARNRFFADGERPAKSAALIGPLWLGKRQPLDQFQQLPGLVERGPHRLGGTPQPQFPQSMAALVQPHPVRKLGGQPGHFQHIDQVLAQLVDPRPQRFERRVVMEVLVIVRPHHRHATSRGAHHRVVGREDLDKPAGQWLGIGGAARVRHRLPAARLGLGEIDLHPQLLQQLDRGEPDLGIELIDVTGNEQTNPRHWQMLDETKGTGVNPSGQPSPSPSRRETAQTDSQVATRSGPARCGPLGSARRNPRDCRRFNLQKTGVR